MLMNPYSEHGRRHGSGDPVDLPRIVADIRDRFPVSGVLTSGGVRLIRAGRELKGCCAFHEDRTPSLFVYADDRRWQCFGCSAQGDVLDAVQRLYGVKLLDAIRMLDGGALAELEQRRAPAKPKADLRPVAQRIVNGSSAIEGTPAEAYLRSRGITMDLPHTLRFARLTPPKIDGNGLLAANGPDPLPALVAIVTDPAGELIGLQRTYLTEDGRKALVIPTASDPKPKVRYSLGNVVGGAIQLGPVSETLVVTEGTEDALTLAQELPHSVWVAAGTAMLSRMVLPDAVRSVVIGADSDAPGEAAAQAAAEAFSEHGRSVRIMRPPAGAKDWNAALMGVAA